jgi:hypothetical protein
MATRKSSVNHAVTALFSITGTELASQLADFCGLKKLAWSPDNKVLMAKTPASIVVDEAWSVLQGLPVATLQAILAELLKPIKQHHMFDLADWMRDLDSVPEYLQVYWSNNRIPASLDALLKKALASIDNSKSKANGDDDVAAPKQIATSKAKITPKKSGGAKTLNGFSGRGARPDMKTTDLDIVFDTARQALTDKAMLRTASKTVWTRVHRAVNALLVQHGLEIGSTRPQRFETSKKNQAQVVYYITQVDSYSADYNAFQKHLQEVFGDQVADVQAVNDEEPPRSFKVWFTHA